MKKLIMKLFFPIAWLFREINSLWYDLQVKVHALKKPKQKRIGRKIDKIKDLIFYAGFMAVPLIMFVITKILINGKSILLAFEKYNEKNEIVFAGLENFAKIIHNFKHDANFPIMFKRSVIIYLFGTITGSFFPILLSYYIYKKLFGYKLFKVILFLPTILSSIITVSMYRIIANEVVPFVCLKVLHRKIYPLLSNPNTTFYTLLFYSLWMGFGGGLLTQLAAMNTVDPSVSEAAKLDGIGFFGELWHIVLPASYQVIMLGFITGVAGIFTNTLNLYAFFGTGAPDSANNLGYYFQLKTLTATYREYNYLSAWGLCMTAIVLPITLLLRHLIFTYGPSEESHEKKHFTKKV